jgi:O-antigen ligase
LEIWRTILAYVSNNLFTGSGFLGVWVIYDAAGSAHNQFMDAMLRLGVIGAAAYFGTLIATGKYLYGRHAGLFVGYVGVLTYGLFHETFKEPQGAFALAFLVGMYATHLRHMRIDATDHRLSPAKSLATGH